MPRRILITPAPVEEELQPNRSNERLQHYANAVKEVADETNSHFIDFFSVLYSKTNYKELLKGEKDDGLHFGEATYEILTDLIVQKLKEIDVNKK